MTRRIEEAWAADGVAARILTPLAWAFRGVVAVRNAAFDAGLLRAHPLGLPAVSIGNLTVGGTGKTPVSAWCAGQLAARGHRVAILLRGHGGDEPLVHERLNPGATVIADPDRVAGAARARAAGATALVLDDAFQHRRARRDLDLVLVAAEQGRAHRLLPAGPLREPAGALRRAHGLLVTRKASTIEEAEEVARRWAAAAPGLPTAVLHLRPGPLRSAQGAPAEGPALAGRRLLAISAIGDPGAFEAQLRAGGAEIEGAAYPDHHPFSDAEVSALAARAARSELAVCTLKDAVKLAPRWPRQAPPLWYLSQAVIVERGERLLAGLLDRLGGPPPQPTTP